jgi:hypothetical protein
VQVDKRGRFFYARVLGAGATGGLTVEPLDRRISWRQATAREVRSAYATRSCLSASWWPTPSATAASRASRLA